MRIQLIQLVVASAFLGNAACGSDVKFVEPSRSTGEFCLYICPKDGMSNIVAGQTVTLAVTMTNISTNISFRLFRPTVFPLKDGSYSVSVEHPSGTNASVLGINLFAPSLPGIVVDWHPLEVVKIEVDVTDVCQFNDPGVYTITLKKLLRNPQNKRLCWATSNPLKLTVSPHAPITDTNQTAKPGSR